MWCLNHSQTAFFFNDTATTEIYTLSLHDALPIYGERARERREQRLEDGSAGRDDALPRLPLEEVLAGLELLRRRSRSEEHTSELQSRQYLVCRLLLEKKNSRLLVYPKAITSPQRR